MSFMLSMMRACSFPLSYQANFFENSAWKLLTSQNAHTAPLRSGLYVVRSFLSTAEEQAYVLYWPEDTTWDDQAVSSVQRNRVTFMRYEWIIAFALGSTLTGHA